MADEIRRRAACDRCHSQKIRCPRQPGQAVCSRCVKSGSQCIFSPFRQKKTPEENGTPEFTTTTNNINSRDATFNGQRDASPASSPVAPLKRRRIDPEPAIHDSVATTSSQAFELFNIDDLSLDWMQNSYSMSQDAIDPTFSQLNPESQHIFSFPEDTSTHGTFYLMNPDPNPLVQQRKERNFFRSLKTTTHLLLDADNADPQSSSQTQSPIPEAWSRGNAFAAPEPESVGHCIRKLSQLSADLFQHSQTIPPLSIHDPDHPDQVKAFQSGDNSEFALEETFRLTQGLIDIYPAFLSTFVGRQTIQASESPFTWPDTSPESCNSSSPETTEGTSPPQLTRFPLDHSSIFLILSVHIRIVEMYEQLFKHIEMCIKQKGMPLTPQQEKMKVPQLAIGNYRPPPSSSVPMQMLLLVQFASQLFNYAADLCSEIEGLHSIENSPQEASTMALTRAAVANVKDRAHLMSQELGSMRGRMLHSGMLA